jgi:hypothetical protein
MLLIMPAEVNVIMPLPATFTATLPADVTTLTLLLPLCIDVASMPVNALPLPLKKLPVMLPVADIKPAVMMLPPVTLPEALKLAGLNVPAERVPLAITLLPVMLPEADIPVVPSKLNAIFVVLLSYI